MLSEKDLNDIKRQNRYAAIIALHVTLFSTIGLYVALDKFWHEWMWIRFYRIADSAFYWSLIILGWLAWGGMIWLINRISEYHENYLIAYNELRLLREELYKLKNQE